MDGVRGTEIPRWLMFGEFDQGDRWVKGGGRLINKGSERKWLCRDFCLTVGIFLHAPQ